MFKNVRYTTVALFCLTFIVGLLSSDVYQPIVTVREKESSKNITSKTNKAVKKALELLEKENLECVPVDGRLKYRLIKKESQVLVAEAISKEDKSAQSNKENVEPEKKLKEFKELTEKQKSELTADEKKLEYQPPFYNSERYGEIDRDLLYREVCKEIK